MVNDRHGRVDTGIIEEVTDKGIVRRGNKTGYFAEGTVGGPGRLPSTTEKKYLVGMHAVVSVEDWQEITRRAVEDALQGKASARSWLSKYLLDPILRTTVGKAEMSEVVDEGGQVKKIIKFATMLEAMWPELQEE
jgi:hypothetical protein